MKYVLLCNALMRKSRVRWNEVVWIKKVALAEMLLFSLWFANGTATCLLKGGHTESNFCYYIQVSPEVPQSPQNNDNIKHYCDIVKFLEPKIYLKE